jgi:hypothetical protein
MSAAPDYIDELLASGPAIEEVLNLAQARGSGPKLHVLILAGALVQAAFEGGVPYSYVLDAVKSALAAATAPDPMAH